MNGASIIDQTQACYIFIFRSSGIFTQQMCGTAITQGCMLGHAKDEFFDEKNLNSGMGTEDSFTAFGYVCFSLIKF